MLMRGEVGELKAGQLADITLLDTSSPAISPMNDACGMITYCEAGGSVKHVIVNGDVVVRDRKIVSFDAEAIAQEFRERVDRLPFRKPIDTKTQKDVNDCWAFWWDVMARVNRGE